MARSVSVTEVLRNFADYINRVVYRGERFVLMRGGKAVAELSPVPAGTRLEELPALLESLPRLSAEDAEEFDRDLARVRSELPPWWRDPWES